MSDIQTFKTKTDSVTVHAGDAQADVSTWANHEGVTLAVTTKYGSNVLAGSLRWEQMEALCAAFALVKAQG